MVEYGTPKTFLTKPGALEIVSPAENATNLKRRTSGWQRTGAIVGLLTRAVILRDFLLLHHISLFEPAVIVSAINAAVNWKSARSDKFFY
jgi:hypothetical protein